MLRCLERPRTPAYADGRASALGASSAARAPVRSRAYRSVALLSDNRIALPSSCWGGEKGHVSFLSGFASPLSLSRAPRPYPPQGHTAAPPPRRADPRVTSTATGDRIQQVSASSLYALPEARCRPTLLRRASAPLTKALPIQLPRSPAGPIPAHPPNPRPRRSLSARYLNLNEPAAPRRRAASSLLLARRSAAAAPSDADRATALALWAGGRRSARQEKTMRWPHIAVRPSPTRILHCADPALGLRGAQVGLGELGRRAETYNHLLRRAPLPTRPRRSFTVSSKRAQGAFYDLRSAGPDGGSSALLQGVEARRVTTLDFTAVPDAGAGPPSGRWIPARTSSRRALMGSSRQRFGCQSGGGQPDAWSGLKRIARPSLAAATPPQALRPSSARHDAHATAACRAGRQERRRAAPEVRCSENGRGGILLGTGGSGLVLGGTRRPSPCTSTTSSPAFAKATVRRPNLGRPCRSYNLVGPSSPRGFHLSGGALLPPPCDHSTHRPEGSP